MKKTLTLTVLTVAAALTVTACAGADPLAAGDDSDGSSVIIGSADFTESQLIASIYSQGLQAAGIDVKEQFNIGSREVYIAALQDGSIDLLPEYSGALLKYLDQKSTASTSEDVLTELQDVLPDGVSILKASDAQDKDVLAVTKETAEKYQLSNFSDLKPVAGELSLGGPSEWETRINGVLGLEQVYGLKFKEFVSLDAGGPLTITALTSDQIQVADVFSTNPAVEENDLVALEDDKLLFAAENVVPVIRTAKSNETIEKTLDAISAELTTEDLIAMNSEAASGTNLEAIAKKWLIDAGLI